MLTYLKEVRNRFFWNRLRSIVGTIETAIDLGSGSTPKNDFHARSVWSLDIVESSTTNHIQCDAALGTLNAGDSYFDVVTAYDFLEHIPRVTLSNEETRFPFIELMNEIHRILKPQGFFYSYTPVFPKKSAFQDPTHVNIMTKDTLRAYFCGDDPIAEIYGFTGHFAMVRSGWKGSHHYCLMQKY